MSNEKADIGKWVLAAVILFVALMTLVIESKLSKKEVIISPWMEVR